MNQEVRLTDRTQAREVIRPELVAAHGRAPLDVARSVHEMWFTALEILVRRDRIVLLDEVVIGRPDPHLLEIVYWHRRFSGEEIQELLDDLDDDRWDDDEYQRPEVDELVRSAAGDAVGDGRVGDGRGDGL